MLMFAEFVVFFKRLFVQGPCQDACGCAFAVVPRVLVVAIAGALLAGSLVPRVTGAEAAVPAAEPPERIEAFKLTDQFGQVHEFTLPREKITVLTVADKQGSEQVPGWVAALKARYAGRIAIAGAADLDRVPGFLRGTVRRSFKKHYSAYPVMLDWDGTLARTHRCATEQVTVFVLERDGRVLARVVGPPSKAHLDQLCRVIDERLSQASP